MFWIIFTGILSAGVIPILAFIGWVIEFIIVLFRPELDWTYWQNVGVGLLFLIALSIFQAPRYYVG